MFMVKLARKWNMPLKQFFKTVDMDEIRLQLATHMAYPLEDMWEINAINCAVTNWAGGGESKVDDFQPPFKSTSVAEASAFFKAMSKRK